MRLLVYLLIVGQFATCGLHAQDTIKALEGNEVDYAHEIEKQLEILAEGLHSASLYSNLGYAYYQQADVANAVLYYEKSLKLDPTNRNVISALSLIRSELPVHITFIPDFVLLRGYRAVANLLSASAWSILQLLLFIGLLGVLYMWSFRRDMAPKSAISLVVVLSMLLSLFGLFAYHKKQYEIGGNAAISMSSQNIYKAADDRSEVVITIGPGNKVYFLDMIGDWYKVQLRDKDIGWIEKKGVIKI